MGQVPLVLSACDAPGKISTAASQVERNARQQRFWVVPILSTVTAYFCGMFDFRYSSMRRGTGSSRLVQKNQLDRLGNLPVPSGNLPLGLNQIDCAKFSPLLLTAFASLPPG
jgi:hypothetical protein